MTTFRLLSFEEAEAMDAARPAGADRLEHPTSQHRWHCSHCGRFVRSATVRKLAPRPGEADEHDYRGTCPVHGKVDVVWPGV